jgi:hypothetical protein
VIQVQTQSEILNSYMMRRPNGDEPGNQFRRYEVPGATHVYKESFGYGVSPEDSISLGITKRVFDLTRPVLPNDFPLQYVLDGALANLDLWVRDGTPPPQADHIALANMGYPEVKFVYDDFGNVVSGIRTPYVDVPIATYHLGFPEPGAGYKIPFVDALLKVLYRDHDGYLNQVTQATEKILKDRWITETDAKKIIREAEDSDVLVNKEN